MQQSLVRTAIWAVALVCAALILANGGAVAQRVMIPPEEPAPPPADSDSVPVAVTNFPTVDIRGFPHIVTVEGTVDVGNFPTTQNIAGTVDVGNLPLDADGNVVVSGTLIPESSQVRFVGFTANLPHTTTALHASRSCHAHFAGSRVCEYTELILNVFTPAFPIPGYAQVLVQRELNYVGNVYIVPSLTCLKDDGELELAGCGSRNIFELPVACCGY